MNTHRQDATDPTIAYLLIALATILGMIFSAMF